MPSLPRKVLAVLAVLLAACASPVPRPETVHRGDYGAVRAYIAALARQEMRKADVTGLSVALVDDQNLVWADGFGFADRARDVPAGADTVYRVGSITKLFTAAAVMQLAEQGKLAIDRPIEAVIPGFSMKSRFENARPVTPRLLMSHHAGLPTDILKGFSEPHPRSLAELTRQLQDEYLAFPPGTLWSYSNVGYSLLGRAVEMAAGVPYDVHIGGALLKPLGLTNASITARAPEGPMAAKGYRNGKEAADLVLRDISAGGLNASVRDMSRFLSMIFADGRANGRSVLRPETVREMLRPQNADVPLDLNFRVGLGWMLSGLGEIEFSGAGPVAHHAGGTALFHSQVIVLPAHKLGVVVLSNSASSRKVVKLFAARDRERRPGHGDRTVSREDSGPGGPDRADRSSAAARRREDRARHHTECVARAGRRVRDNESGRRPPPRHPDCAITRRAPSVPEGFDDGGPGRRLRAPAGGAR